jgi:hypothetical protein
MVSAIGGGSWLGRFAMRKALIVAVLSAAFVVSATAKEQRGAILSVDDAGKTFICHWGANDWTYKTTDKTAFRVRGKNASWSDLKVGVRVNVGYHLVGKERVADWVNIEQR